jgi:hypothetical protein
MTQGSRSRPFYEKAIFSLLIIPAIVGVLTWIAQNKICNFRKSINVQGKIILSSQPDTPPDNVVVSIRGIDIDTTINGEFQLSMETTSPRFSNLGCMSCESSTSNNLEILVGNELYYYPFLFDNEALTSDEFKLPLVRIPEDCEKIQ